MQNYSGNSISGVVRPGIRHLTGMIVDLVTAYQRAAFLEGIHIGVRLAEAFQIKSAPRN